MFVQSRGCLYTRQYCLQYGRWGRKLEYWWSGSNGDMETALLCCVSFTVLRSYFLSKIAPFCRLFFFLAGVLCFCPSNIKKLIMNAIIVSLKWHPEARVTFNEEHDLHTSLVISRGDHRSRLLSSHPILGQAAAECVPAPYGLLKGLATVIAQYKSVKIILCTQENVWTFS